MRRLVIAAFVLTATAALGAGAYTAYATDREYTRQIAAGDDALAAGRGFQALEAYSVAITLRPDSMLAHLKRGVTYRSRGELDLALRDLRHAHALDATATMPLELAGDTSLDLERYDRAIERYHAYLALDDRSAAVWYKLGLAQYRAGRRADARLSVGRALTLDEASTEAHMLLGLCLRDDGERERAAVSLLRATALAPAATGPREALAEIYAESGQHARAVDQLEALAALDASRPARFVALGLAYARARRHEAAVLTLSRAVERFPNEPLVYAALGRVWLQAAEVTQDRIALSKAIEALSVAASDADVDGPTLALLGRARLAAGQLAGAERAFQDAIARPPVPADAFLHLAGFAERSGRLGEARDHLVRYLTLSGDSESIGAVATRIARHSLAIGEPAVARRWIDRAIDDGGASPALTALRQRADAAAAQAGPPR